MGRRAERPMLWMLLVIISVQVLSLGMMPALSASEVRVFEDPSATSNAILYIVLVLIFTGFLLLATRLGWGWLVSGTVQLCLFLSVFYVLGVYLPWVLAFSISLALMLAMVYYPEWYVVDLLGILVSAGVSVLFGLSMETLPVVVLLAILAVYDAISVYKTKHMVTLAESVINIRAPLLFVIPKSRSYSFRGRGADRREAYFLGLGDAIMPSVLVVSANWSLPAGHEIFGVALPAIGAMLGTYMGFMFLATTSGEKPQAGLPFLNGGAVIGFLAGCMLSGVRPF
ncbi:MULTISPECIES: presenilin family intramembrane aspartyl protease PSH [Methanothrix]|uniref:Signal peptide peptidase n=1 Tax=Methanothrix thermoacetophila (strain DSM 6194 / JCM 14653 / NBRC 101360 / PT) TaxID=349307 RepID=A0B7U6_METTP|nr:MULTISPECIES: presenilin family intramembrane aspartyl protease PSH [Methanothrix]ABK14770.1 Protein of unknown function DUF1119 [Methanothrix thermoacetophila PT]